MADHTLHDLMGVTMDKIRELASSNTIIGDPITTPEGTTILPVSKVTFGVASGGSDFAGKNDKEHIDSIAQTSNRFREYIVNLLRAEDSEGASYRDNVANLHEALQHAALMTQEYIGTRQAISFSSVASKNLNAAERFDYYKNHYECTRIRGKIITSEGSL